MTVFEYAVCLLTFFFILFTGIEIGPSALYDCVFAVFYLLLDCCD